MHELLKKNVFFVKEHTGVFKASNNYDIYDAETNDHILNCREEIGFLTKLFRFTKYKRMTPFNIEITTPEGEQVVRVNRGISIFLSDVSVFNEQNNRIGGFKQKLFSIGGAFKVLDANGQEVCELKGKWTSWEFSFIRNGQQLAQVTKKWSGIGKELFTSADNYVLEINESEVAKDDPIRQLILAAVMCIDMVLKE